MSEEKKTGLYIPERVLKRKEIARGIGWKELGVMAIYMIIGVVIGIVLVVVKGQVFFPAIPFLGLLFLAIGYVFNQKDRTNKSTVEHVKHLVSFVKSQKKYKYKKIKEEE